MSSFPTHDLELVELNETAVEKHIQAMGFGVTSNKVTRLLTDLLSSGCATEETVAFKMPYESTYFTSQTKY